MENTDESWIVADTELLRDIEALKACVSKLNSQLECQNERIDMLLSKLERYNHTYSRNSNVISTLSGYIDGISVVARVVKVASPLLYWYWWKF
jgi:hypothetical protein